MIRWRSLPDNGKDPFLAGRFFPVDLDPLDLSLAGAAVTPTDDFLNGWSAPFKDCLHTTIAQIAYPSFDLRFTGAVTGVGAEAYPLDTTGNKDMSTNEIHKPPVYFNAISIIPA